MSKRQKRWPIGPMLALSLGLLIEGALIPTATVSSAPLGQEQPGEDLYLDYGDDVTKTLYAYDGSELFETFVFRVHMPAGAQLTVWLGEDARGGCYSEGLLFVDGSQVGHTTVGPAPSSWSDPIVATVSAGYAQLAFRGYDDCDASVAFPVEKYVRFKVGDAPAPVVTTPPPTIEFWADRTTIEHGECTTLHWQTEHVKAVYYQGESVPGDGNRQECPQETTTYELYVVIYQAAEQLIDETRYVTVHVEEPITLTHTPTPSPAPTPITPTPTRYVTRAPTAAPTRTPTRIPTGTPTRMPTRTSTPFTPTSTRLATRTPTPTPTPTPTSTPTQPSTQVKLLVVTNSQLLNSHIGTDTWTQVQGWLDQRYGHEGYYVLDVADYPSVVPPRCQDLPFPDQCAIDMYIELRWGLERYWAIFIVGGHGIVPQAAIPNPVAPIDNDILWTDDLYADMNGDWIPDTPLARLPDGRDLSLLRTQLTQSSNTSAPNMGFVMANNGLTYAEQFAAAAGTQVIYSPPFDRWQTSPSGVNSGFAYFDLGAIMTGDPPLFNRAWWGCDSFTGQCGPVAFTPEDANTRGVVVTGASYAGLAGCQAPGCPHIRGTFPLQFLANGAQAYIATTVRNYRIPVTMEERTCTVSLGPLKAGCDTQTYHDWSQIWQGVPLFTQRFIRHWGNTYDPLVSYHLAKVDTLRNGYGLMAKGEGGFEVKMGHGLVYYGVPGPAPKWTAKPTEPNTSASPWVAINVERPLEVLETVDKPVPARGTGMMLGQGCGFLDCADQTADSDRDGLSDALEWRLAYEFEPFLEFDEAESANPRNPYDLDIYHQVSPESGNGTTGKILLTFVLAYDQDYGSVNYTWVPQGAESVFEAHSGDSETMRVRLDYEFAFPYLWVRMDGYEIKRHFDDPESYDPVSGGGPYLYISRDKHAAYPSVEECHNYTFEQFELNTHVRFEECAGGPSGWASDLTGYLLSNHNVGEVEPGTRHWLEHTYTFNNYPLWDENARFCGNHDNCDRYWSPIKTAIDASHSFFEPLVGWLPYGSKANDLATGVNEGIAGRFFDKGAGALAPKWFADPQPVDLKE